MAVSAALQLELYNGALEKHLGERPIASLASTMEARYLLDRAWKSGRFINACLEEAPWSFALRTIELAYDPSIEPDFGFPFAFKKEPDWVKTAAISPDPNFVNRLDESGYTDENGYWFTYPQLIYVQYVSNDNAYGLDTSKWPEYFIDWLEVRLALKACKRDTQSSTLYADITKDEKRFLLNARGKDGMNKAATKTDKGSWNKARTTSRLSSVWGGR